MTQTIAHLTDKSNHVLNIVKALHGFRRKDEALNYVVEEYGQEVLGRQIRPEYLEKLERIGKTKAIPVKDFGKRYGLT